MRTPKDNGIEWLKLEMAHTVAMSRGFQPIEVPWIVSPDISNATFVGTPVHSLTTPPKIGVGYVPPTQQLPHDGTLIGSGEQGFLAIWDQLAPNSKYVTTTPCFRAEVGYEKGVKEPWFMKTELIWTSPTNEGQALAMVMETARRIMGAWTRKIDQVSTPDGIDFYLAGLEVGSYGVRSATFSGVKRTWVYGTGLAEPRFTTALRRVVTKVTVGKPKP